METFKIIGIIIFLVITLPICIIGIISDIKSKNHYSEIFVSGYKFKLKNENKRNKTNPK